MTEYAAGLGNASRPQSAGPLDIPTFEAGGRGRRLGAFIVDVLIQLVPILIIMGVVFSSRVDRPWFIDQPDGSLMLRAGAKEELQDASLVAGLATTAFVALYGIVFVALWSKTPGKKAFGLRVISTDGPLDPTPVQALTREFVRALPGVAGIILAMMAGPPWDWVGSIGSLIFTAWLLWDPLAQTIYDKAAGTIVVRDRPIDTLPPTRTW